MTDFSSHVGLVVYNDVDYGLDVANALHKAGVTVSLYMSQKHVAASIQEPERTKDRIYELGLLDPHIPLFLFQFPRIRSPRSLKTTLSVVKTMRANGVDVAHLLFGPAEIWLAVLPLFLWKMPVVSTIIIPEQNAGDRLARSMFFGSNYLTAHGSDLVIVNGSNQVSVMEKTYKVASDRIAYVPLGPRTTAARWSNRRDSEEPKLILFFGKAYAHKGLEYLIRAQPLISQRFADARVLISSHGEDLNRCMQMIQDNPRFEIHEGFASGVDAASYFTRASMVVLPYLSASTSGILVTAYVFGKPVVATSVGCLPEYVIDGVTGILVPPANEQRLADAIVRLLSDDDARQRMGANAREWAEKLEDQTALQTIDVYERAIRLHTKTRAIN